MTDTLRAVLDGSARYAALRGDNVEWLRQLPDASVDAVVTDPPYGLGKVPDMVDVLRAWLEGGDYKASGGGFMGRAWDAFVPGPATWREVWRVLKPGGHVLAFAGTRTWDAVSLALRLAGFELRDTIASHGPALAWFYASGFPKSHSIPLDFEQELCIYDKRAKKWRYRDTGEEMRRAAPFRHPMANQWDGYGTSLKPAWEPILVFRKPLAEGTVAAQVLATGTGALHIDACRVAGEVPVREDHGAASGPMFGINSRHPAGYSSAGRWPSNLVLSHSPACVRVGTRRVASNGAQPAHYGMGYHGANGAGTGERYTRADPDGFETVDAWECAPDCPVAELDRQSGTSVDRATGYNWQESANDNPTHIARNIKSGVREVDAAGASRFFPTFAYVAKASPSERDAGLEAFPVKTAAELTGREEGSAGLVMNGGANPYAGTTGRTRRNPHPTVKPLALMRWLVRLVTPPGGVVLDPWMGSGSTGVAVALEAELAARFIGFELDADGHDYVGVASARIAYALEEASKPAPVAKRLHKQRVEKPASGSQVTRTSDDTFSPSKAPSSAPASRRRGTRRRKPRAQDCTYSLWGAPELWTEPVEVGMAG